MQCAHYLGLAEGLVTLLRGISHNARHNRVYLPTNIMEKQGLKPQEVVQASKSNSTDGRLRAVCQEIAGRAHQHLQECRRSTNQLTIDERLLLLPAVAVDSYLKRLKKVSMSIIAFEMSTNLEDDFLLKLRDEQGARKA